ncbi:PREDICTED: uncharacterized protein LOC104592977 isoform X1 [Nelumbo nucifera]|uniref:Uncharacterized protein LOC104592977 isoform X1 n=1 Tax=Nelumbo nucifera TaxID=4432 RepID=A0A1U7ZBG0_NELNU|nr:PREDICTED: uncharacterized protein LOC104592977 isoform X1 [Nelumbo nucifera]
MLASFWLAVELLTLGNLWTTLPLSKQLFSNLCPTKNHEVHDQPHSKPPFFLLFPAAAISSEFQALDSDSFITSIRSERLFLTELSKPFVRMKPVQKMDFNPANAIWDPQSLEKFLFAIEDPEVLKAPLLKSLYCLLVYLFSNSSLHCSNFEALKDSNVGSHQFDLKVTFAVICKLSNFLFKELQRRFEQLLSGLLDVSVNTATGQDKVLNHPEDLTMLLRCCLIIMLLLVFDQSFLMEKCQILLVVLRKLCSPDLLLHVSCHMKGNEKSTISLKRSVSHERIYASDNSIISVVEELDASMSFSEQIGMPIPILCSMLEVFADELLVHRRLRQYFIVMDSVSCTSEKLFICDSSHGDSDDVLEVISAHFLLSVSGMQPFNKFLNTLFWLDDKELRFPELSLTAAMVLLGTPTIFSAPQVFQAHLISLIARAFGIIIVPEETRLNPRAKNCYISAFEHSVILYNRHISSLEFGSHHFGSNIRSVDKPCTLEGGCHPSFQSYVRPITYNRIIHEIPKSTFSWHLGVHDSHSKMTSSMMSASVAYMAENLCILDNTCKDEAFSILNCIISRILSSEIVFNVLNKNVDGSSEKMCLLASILKLMSSSLLQIVWYLKQNGNLGCLKTLKDYPSCREYDFIVGKVGCFQQYSVSQPIQHVFSDARGADPGRHKESMAMLMHMAELLLFSFSTGLEFLWKSCIFMMMAIMNLIIFEEGNLDALRPLLGFEKESAQPSLDKSPKVLIERSSSALVAWKFQKIKTMRLRSKTLTRYNAEAQDVQSETLENTLVLGDVESQCVLGMEEEDTCNGSNFIKIIRGGHPTSDFDDLVDFIECKQGKDYSKWLKDRERYRKWKCEKVAAARHKRKKTLQKFLTGK